jgi:regulator of sirC expression with transglutaminase-like and TPR domain
VRAAHDPAQRVAALNRFLYEEQGFHGNRSDYYDARNSFLNEVIERRTGIPITLAVIYLAVGTRAGLPLHGVGFPGHFLVKCEAADEIVIDPFEGRVVSRDECEARWRATLGEDTPFDARSLEAAAPRPTLARLIGNLKQVFLAQQDWPRALACVERILVLAPDAPLELRDRGLLYARLECFSAAAADLQRFLELAPGDPTAVGVRQQLVELMRTSPPLN